MYILKNSQNQIILNETGKKRIFGGHDLLKVPDDTLPTVIDLTKANSLNRIPLPKQGDTGRDLYIERVFGFPGCLDSGVLGLFVVLICSV